MRVMVLGLALVAASGCSDPVADAEQRLEIVKRNGDTAEVCRQSRIVADEYLKQKNENAYYEAKVAADIYCQGAKLNARY